jgi:hypothetical protein
MDTSDAKHVDTFLISDITKNNENRKLLHLFTADLFLYSKLPQKITSFIKKNGALYAGCPN